MKAIVWHGIGDIRLDEVPDPSIEGANDAIIEITNSAICGTDLHLVRGTMGGMREGTVLGHEAVGVVRAVGSGVRNFRPGERVVVGSTIGCGSCSIGAAMNKNLIIKMGTAEHRRYIPHLLDLVASGVVDPSTVLTQERGLDTSALEAYEQFDQREEGWIKTVLEPTR